MLADPGAATAADDKQEYSSSIDSAADAAVLGCLIDVMSWRPNHTYLGQTRDAQSTGRRDCCCCSYDYHNSPHPNCELSPKNHHHHKYTNESSSSPSSL